ncbi:MAG: T9SS type A sorting domain-containing protein [Weeksellaceae bacterium]|nr:T9SS type A sorting domain-containing protein [Weeksellaceae bacterium]
MIIKLYPAQISVDDIAFENIEIYPNPTNGILNFTEPVKNITIYDISGKTVKTRSETSKIIDLSGLAKGVYIVKGVTQGGKTFEGKIIKK